MEFVYFILENVAGSAIKIGRATDPEKRLLTLQTGNPRPLYIEYLIVGGQAEERLLHDYWASARVGGEWFGYGMQSAILNVGVEIAIRQYRAEVAGETQFPRLHRFVRETLEELGLPDIREAA